MVEKEKLMILKVSESKKPKQLRVTIPLNEGVEGGRLRPNNQGEKSKWINKEK